MFDKVVDAALSLWPEFNVEATHLTNSQDEQNMGTVHFEVRTATVLVAKFSLSKMPGTLWLYSHGACVAERFRGQGIGKRMNEFRKRIAERAGAWGLLEFAAGSNVVQRNLLQKQGWMRLVDLDTPTPKGQLYSQEIWVYVTRNFGGQKEQKEESQ